jgi:hypothetical protein
MSLHPTESTLIGSVSKYCTNIGSISVIFAEKMSKDVIRYKPTLNSAESSNIATNTTYSVAPSETSLTGAVTPGRSAISEESEHPRPNLEIGKSPSAHGILGSQGQSTSTPAVVNAQMPSSSRGYSSGEATFVRAHFTGSGQSYTYEQLLPPGRPSWGPPPHPGPPMGPGSGPGQGSPYPNQYPAPVRSYHPTGNPNRPPSNPQRPNHPGYSGN